MNPHGIPIMAVIVIMKVDETLLREGKSTGIKKRYIIPYLFILPAFIIHMCVVTGPALSTLVMSMFDWNGLGNAKFIGLNNFKEIFQDPLVKDVTDT